MSEHSTIIAAGGIEPERQSSLAILQGKHDALREIVTTWRVDDQELSELRVKLTQQALRLQAKEYKRRLNTLNHSHEIEIGRNANFITREVFDRTIQELRNIDGVAVVDRRAIEEKARERIADLARLIYIGIGMLLAVEVLLKFIKFS